MYDKGWGVIYQGGFRDLLNLVLTRYESKDSDLVQHIKGLGIFLSWASRLRLACKRKRMFIKVPKDERGWVTSTNESMKKTLFHF